MRYASARLRDIALSELMKGLDLAVSDSERIEIIANILKLQNRIGELPTRLRLNVKPMKIERLIGR